MTIDKFGTGCPVAFCFSNKADEIVFTVFFKSIKLKVGIIKTNVFMSDDDPTFYNAWSHAMSPTSNRLLLYVHGMLIETGDIIFYMLLLLKSSMTV